jgi:hypothetical protein
MVNPGYRLVPTRDGQGRLDRRKASCASTKDGVVALAGSSVTTGAAELVRTDTKCHARRHSLRQSMAVPIHAREACGEA